MPKLILLNKPYGVICQFSPSPPHQCLADYVSVKDVYAAGRLDTDSEGLLLLTDNGPLQHKITDPKHKLVKTYWVQVEGIPDDAALQALRAGGLDLGDFKTLPAEARVIEQPEIVWPRVPPIRERAAIPTSWLEIKISEGKNRQVRRMTAKVGYPTLRLIRYAIGSYTLDGVELGQMQTITVAPVHVPNPNPKPAGKPKQRGRRGPNKVR
ncbi:pseudouridine synthase [Deefgea tanakiae]|uniref:Pseudouridine synthase n=1 Tax=Deefgea tanakiae TaxID=2865840 RepID=A0ABX8Z2W9_9NEIS|nr:pseudouridine synthase [Deefgea tanakiae]QZA76932.1 pseudouridine synthase [Deefgea tanakiae]